MFLFSALTILFASWLARSRLVRRETLNFVPAKTVVFLSCMFLLSALYFTPLFFRFFFSRFSLLSSSRYNFLVTLRTMIMQADKLNPLGVISLSFLFRSVCNLLCGYEHVNGVAEMDGNPHC